MSRSKLLQHVPHRFLNDNILYSKWLKMSAKESFMCILTKSRILFEMKDREILSSCVIPQDNLSNSVINDTFPNVHLSSSSNQNDSAIHFHVYFAYPNDGSRRVFYLILLENRLHVIERISGKSNSELRAHECVEDCRQFDIIDSPTLGHPVVHIEKSDGYSISRDFISDSANENRVKPQWMSSKGNHQLDAANACLTDSIQVRRQFQQRVTAEASARLKLAPINERAQRKGMRGEQVLLRYGDSWKRLHNDRIVIGVPILNAGQSRQWTATDVCGTLMVSGAGAMDMRLHYKVQLFKLRGDSYLFDNFDDLFRSDQDVDHNQSFTDMKWVAEENNCVHPEQTAVVLFTIDLNNLERNLCQTYQCFVTYNLSDEHRAHAMQLYCGQIDINGEFLLTEQMNRVSPVAKQVTQFLYKDLLTLIVTSHKMTLGLTFKLSPDIPISQFMCKELQFETLDLTKDEESHEEMMDIDTPDAEPLIMLFNDTGFLQDVLIVINSTSTNETELEIYGRIPAQLAFIKESLSKDYPGDIAIIDGDQKIDLVKYETIRSILDELATDKLIMDQQRIQFKSNCDSKLQNLLCTKFAQEVRTNHLLKTIKNSND